MCVLCLFQLLLEFSFVSFVLGFDRFTAFNLKVGHRTLVPSCRHLHNQQRGRPKLLNHHKLIQQLVPRVYLRTD